MTIGIHGTLPFAPQPTLGTSAPDAMGQNLLGRSNSVSNFKNAMQAASGPNAPHNVQGVQVAQLFDGPAAPTATDGVTGVTAPTTVTTAPPVNSANETAVAEARTRAADGLDLRPPTVDGSSGTSILNGLEQLRSVFDGRFNSLGAKLEGTKMDVNSMMALQTEVMQCSVLIDVSSKLAGKSTQAMDTLMKGQ